MKLFSTLFKLAILGLFVYFLFLILPTGTSGEKHRFVVSLEEDQKSVVERLKKDGFVRNKKMLIFFVSILRFPGNIEPGAYMLSKNMTAFAVANILINHPYQKWIVLVPGLRVEQIVERLAKKLNWNEQKTKEFLENSQEGYMFPDTYLLNVDYSGVDVAKRLIANFHEHFDEKLQDDLLRQDVRNDTAIKIASLIERESGSADDKNLIAGVIWNRLNKNMKLQIDATNQYVLGKSGNWWPKVSGNDMKVDSLYNTYLHKGLPPGPICNPSLDAIKAAVYPEETDCLFYLHDELRNIHCSQNYEEHLKNIELYLK